MVAKPRQRTLGVRRPRTDATSRCQHRRLPDRRKRPAHPPTRRQSARPTLRVLGQGLVIVKYVLRRSSWP